MTFTEWQTKAARMNAISRRILASRMRRIRRTAKAAGLDPTIASLHAHNAVVSADYGRPWPEVKYSLARKVLWLEKTSWEANRIIERWDARVRSQIVY